MDFAAEHGIPYRVTGKLVVATGRVSWPGWPGWPSGAGPTAWPCAKSGAAEISEIEPSVRGIRALHIPESGVIDYRKVAASYASVVASRVAPCAAAAGYARSPRRRRVGGADRRGAAAQPGRDRLRRAAGGPGWPR